ncbi:unnamed protein product [Ostreobium quekettii]|uniref:Protein RER1 n=1 Tax=Ostreobium quekettii TaxID=121088 RepID=A0A8S1JE77_9CHLO|nr:unnamed protein product [Ostreobium quekettii]|eukprot:evm.model.scf_609.9 EVM.evm.TU.scf_609.9   scf_609:64712-65248(+)
MAESEPLDRFRAKVSRTVQFYLDKSTPRIAERWLALAALIVVYAVRVYLLRGFYIVTYGLGIYNLNLLIGFLTPQSDPGLEGPELPTKADDEFRPFARRLPEFKFWLSCSKSVLTGLLMTLFPVFDVPVFWPILLLYWVVLFMVTMKRQIKHMIKYRYLPFSWGKAQYTGKPAPKDSK